MSKPPRRPPAQPKPKASDTPIELTPDEVAFTRSLVIHEDDSVFVLNKPAGLSSQGGRIKAHTLDDLLWALARRDRPRPRLIHRLDRDTSGVILTARTKPAATFLGKALMGKRFRKTYLAIVAPGAPEPRGGQIDKALRRESIGREAYMRVCEDDHPDAETARSRYRTLAANAQAALVELSPDTGRMHQLRVHMASIGRPIAGDSRYGGTLMLAGAPVPRLMLHAARLVFPHPEGGERRIEAPLPDDFKAVLEKLDLALPER
ncbi:RluA family pseudouridine synthase [Caulobacter flavus]|uniref:RluA family pseudouridine synthase n=1 Tax=Caulobacter flavus TaxID=1679497 RepID=A0A2N5CKZ0_9CAUL|nr:RluA family pseudouridine synthase [Caulobacter flavus]AYV47245.1 RluA family pseudouridine synthase [Caulobacter flavus]PLR06210.1 RluA family pseudouridine synthase [Caulobacter flavus]